MESDFKKCEGLALSMFDNKNGATRHFAKLHIQMGNKVYQTIGNRISKGIILEENGVNGLSNKLGHFNHHPALGVDYSEIFQILEEEKL